MGHIPGPLIFTVDQLDITQGMYSWTAGPRFSNGYGDARHIPTILLENHSLKPYRQRVLGTYVFLEGCLRAVADDIDALRGAIATDRLRRDPQVHLGYEAGDPRQIDFLAVKGAPYDSPVTGGPVMAWTGEVEEIDHPARRQLQPHELCRAPAGLLDPGRMGRPRRNPRPARHRLRAYRGAD